MEQKIREAIKEKCNQGGRVSRKDLYEHLNEIFNTNLETNNYHSNSDSYWFNCNESHEEDYVVNKIIDNL